MIFLNKIGLEVLHILIFYNKRQSKRWMVNMNESSSRTTIRLKDTGIGTSGVKLTLYSTIKNHIQKCVNTISS